MERQSQQFLKKRKFLLVAPVLIVPFLTMAFWAAGGGKGKTKTIAIKQGLNPRLPDAKLKDDKGLNKMSFYELAQKDSLKLKEAMEKERYHLNFKNDSDKYSLSTLKSLANNYSNRYHQRGLTDDDEIQNPEGGTGSSSKLAEQNLMKKLQKLEEQINKPKNEDESYERRNSQPKTYRRTTDMSTDVDRLEKMMHVMKDSKDNNPEIKQLDTVLEKILDLQYPDRAKEKIKEKAKQEKKEVAVVKPVQNNTPVTVLGSRVKPSAGAGFYGVGNGTGFDSGEQNAIDAAAYETQTLVSGSVLKLRLLDDITINGYVIPKDNFVFGIAKLSGERLIIEISSIAYNNSIFPVNLEVYDLDGLAGIYVPGSISRNVAKQSANSSVESMSFSTLDPSFGAQAAAAGVNAAKDLFSKKIKLVRVTVKAGYRVLLKISNN